MRHFLKVWEVKHSCSCLVAEIVKETVTVMTTRFKDPSEWAPAVESSIAVEDAVENRGLYRIFVSCLF